MKKTHRPDILTPASLKELASFKGPCLSLYQPTHRSHPDNQQDPIRFRHLVQALEKSLRQQHPADAVKSLIEPFEALAEDQDFWNHTLDGLAVLSAPKLFRVFLLQRQTATLAELAVVSDSFHTKPLRRWLQSTGRYQVLALSLHKVQLYEGDRNALDVVSLAPGVLQAMSAELGGENAEPHTTASSFQVIGDEAVRHFRAIDRAVLEHHSRPTGLPLMLAALPEHHHLFRQVSHNPLLMAEGLMVDPQGLTQEQLRQRAWDVAAPQQKAQQTEWSDTYAAAAAKGLGSEDLAQVAHAAAAGRVATLLIEAQRQVAGRIDASTGRIDPAGLDNPHVDDVLDDLGELVESMGGKVHVLSAECMPSRTGVAASFRH